MKKNKIVNSLICQLVLVSFLFLLTYQTRGAQNQTFIKQGIAKSHSTYDIGITGYVDEEEDTLEAESSEQNVLVPDLVSEIQFQNKNVVLHHCYVITEVPFKFKIPLFLYYRTLIL